MRVTIRRVALLAATALLAGCAPAEQPVGWGLALQPPTTVIRGTDGLDPLRWRPALTSTDQVVAILEGDDGPSVGVFDQQGALLHRFGRTGSGPGEFRSPNAVGVGPGDSVWVLESGDRASVFSPYPDVEFVRSFAVPMAGLRHVTARGFLSLESLRAYPDAGLEIVPAQLFDWDGNPVDSLRPSWYDRTAESPTVSVVTATGELGWVSRSNAYQVEGITPSGRIAHRVTRDVDWYDAVVAGEPRSRQLPPLPRITDIGPAGDSLLWVLVRRPSDQWQPPEPGPSAVPSAPVQMSTRIMSMRNDDEWETELNLFDLRCDAPPAILTLPGTVRGFAAPGVVWSYAIVEDTVPQLSMARVEVTRANSTNCE